MSNINIVVLVGRLTRDAEVKYTASGTPVSKFSIAVNRSIKRGDNWENEASFIDIVLWGKKAEALNKYLLKGKQIGVEGEIRQDRWEQDGKPRSRIEIVAKNIELLGGGNSNGESNQSGDTRQGSQDSKPSTQSYERYNDGGFSDDIPF